MYGVQKMQLRQLSNQEFEGLKTLCRLAKNMYNVGLYNVRQHYFKTKQFLGYKENNQLSKPNENYQLLNTDAAQQILKKVEENFHSFFGLVKRKDGKARIPKYLDKEGYFELTFPRIKLQKDDTFFLPMSPAFKKQYGKINIKFPSNLKDKKIAEIRIHPKYNASYFEIEYVYKMEVEQPLLDKEKALAIDLGVNNFASCVTTDGASFLVDGRNIKSFNHWYNKENARLQSIKDKQKLSFLTKKQVRLVAKRNHQLRDYLNKVTRYLVDFCIDNQIGTLIAGKNIGWKHESALGKQTNQTFVQIPHSLFVQKLENMCLRYGIDFRIQEESYTSKASFLDDDEVPVYREGTKEKHLFSGKRSKRGLYLTKQKNTVNADINGACNILKKSKHRFSLERVCQGLLANPKRIRLI